MGNQQIFKQSQDTPTENQRSPGFKNTKMYGLYWRSCWLRNLQILKGHLGFRKPRFQGKFQHKIFQG